MSSSGKTNGASLGCCLICLGVLLIGGCEQGVPTPSSSTYPQSPANETPQADTPQQDDLANDELRAELDDVLEFTLQNRHLSLEVHAAWQILHGVLAYQREFLVENDQGELVPVVDHVLAGGHMNGWTTRPGAWLDADKTRRGLRAVLEQGTKTGQGHADQWFAVLAQCNLEPTQTIRVRGHDYTMRDFAEQVMWDVPRNVEREYSWTLIGLTTYFPTNHTWKASDGEEWSIERLVQIEAEQDIDASACGGTHRLIGMTMALNRHMAQGGKIEGNWKLADERIQESIKKARAYQNPDGSFSTNYFRRAGKSPDLAQHLGSTGHTLEFLTLAMTDEQLEQPWVRRSVANMCQLFQETRDYDLECGALYHAIHGLVLYRHRVFGERTYGDTAATTEGSRAGQPDGESSPNVAVDDR